jgi:GT2 family glycosyltransferase
VPIDEFNRTAANPMPSVSCILVNWNGWADTEACLASLLQQDYPSLHIVVVDNGSADDSVERIHANFPTVTVLETHRNLGFASGCNAGMRYAYEQGADLLWMLNNDTVAPADTCSTLVAKAAAEPQAGLIGSVLYYMQEPTRVQAWGGGDLDLTLGRSRHFYTPSTFGPHGYLTFASVLVRREVIAKIGVLYEGFFMYWDDADLALRATAAGFALTVAENTAVLHKEGGSVEYRSPLIDRFYTTAGMRFLKRHSSAPLRSMAIFATNKFGIRLLRGQFKNARAILLGVSDYIGQRHNVYTDQL